MFIPYGMNIFHLDEDPTLFAIYHNDMHIVKMITEHRQMLCSVYRDHPETPFGHSLFRKIHYNHPCTKWVRESISNWLWLSKVSLIMEDEWRYRYGHSSSKRHKSAEIIEKLETPIWLSNIEKTSPALAMPDKYKSDNPIQSYRNLYIYEKIYDKSGRLMCVWRKRGVPDWYAEGVKTVPGHPLAN